MKYLTKLKRLLQFTPDPAQITLKRHEWLTKHLSQNLSFIELIKLSPEIAQYVADLDGADVTVIQEVMCRTIFTNTETLSDMVVWISALTQSMHDGKYVPGVPSHVRRNNGNKLVLAWLPDRKIENYNDLVYKPVAKVTESALAISETLTDKQLSYLAMLSSGLAHDLRQYYREIVLGSVK